MKQEELVFLISLPRSGSTLTQKILAGHKEIYTTSEPWLMLPLANSLNSEGVRSLYDHKAAVTAVSQFVHDIPAGGERYFNQEMAKFTLKLYGSYLSKSSKKVFLDKTPRYYLIVQQLLSIFPRAKFIILHRNPLAVLSSMVEAWTDNNLSGLINCRSDLVLGVKAINKIHAADNVHSVSYESLLKSPKSEVASLLDFIGLQQDDSIVSYSEKNIESWMYGDNKFIDKASGPVLSKSDEWKEKFDTQELWQLAKDYLQSIGRGAFNAFGYDYDETAAMLKAIEEKNGYVNCKVSISKLTSKEFFDMKSYQEFWFDDAIDVSTSRNSEIKMVGELVAELNRMDVNLSNKEEATISLRKDYINLESKNKNLIKSKGKIQLELDELKVRHQKAKVVYEKKVTDLKKRFDNKSAELLEAREQIDVLLEKNRCFDKTICDQADEIRSLISRNSEIIEVYKGNIARLDLQLAKAATEKQALKTTIETRQRRIQTLKSRIAVLRELYEALVSKRLLLAPFKKLKAYKSLLSYLTDGDLFK